MTEQEKAIAAAVTIKAFATQFGEPDERITLLLEVLFEELFNASPISLFSESEQEGDQTTIDPQDGSNNGQIKSSEPDKSETPGTLGN